jgi:hypothetical protein
MNIKQAAELMGCTQVFLRWAIREGKYDWATCVKINGSSRYTYHINERGFRRWLKGL